ncbi:MAG: class I SAM-dependent methyltransferase [Planctomycetota bacterium]
MTDPRLFDDAALFDDDYLWFYDTVITPERTAVEVALIQQLTGATAGTAVLDLACGHGRIANPLAAAGCRVTGLDRSERFLQHARAHAAAAGISVEYVIGDMLDLPAAWTNRFDLLINWFTAFGYFDDATNQRVLAGMRRVIRPGGTLLIELNHRDFLLRNFRPQAITERGDSFMLDNVSFDPLTGRTTTHRTMIRDGRTRRVTFVVRLFTFTEIRDWLNAAGFADVTAVGRDGQPMTLESNRMVLVAR